MFSRCTHRCNAWCVCTCECVCMCMSACACVGCSHVSVIAHVSVVRESVGCTLSWRRGLLSAHRTHDALFARSSHTSNAHALLGFSRTSLVCDVACSRRCKCCDFLLLSQPRASLFPLAMGRQVQTWESLAPLSSGVLLRQ